MRMTEIGDYFYNLPNNIGSNNDSFLFSDDCLSIIKNIKSNSIDLIFADPPYILL